MATEKNVALPEDLLAQIRAAAKAQGRTEDELFEEAARRYLAHQRLSDLVERGKKRSHELGLTEDDVPRLISESRRERCSG